jgi:hypothetical protein
MKKIVDAVKIKIILEKTFIKALIVDGHPAIMMPTIRAIGTSSENLETMFNDQKFVESQMINISDCIIEYCKQNNIKNAELTFVFDQSEKKSKLEPKEILSKYPSLMFLLDRLDDVTFVKEVIQAYLENNESSELQELYGSM